MIAGLRPTGLTAAAVFDGPIDTVTFAADVDQVLIPTLHPGDVVVLDTLAVHYDPAGRTAIEDAGGQFRFLPPYSPDSNPIEQAFAKLKAFLHPTRPRSFNEVTAPIRLVLDRFSPTQCTNYIRNCGYRGPTPKEKTL